MSQLIIAFTGEATDEIELLDESGTNLISVDVIRSNLRDIMKSLSYMLQDMNLAGLCN
jgi:hypothetical protein